MPSEKEPASPAATPIPPELAAEGTPEAAFPGPSVESALAQAQAESEQLRQQLLRTLADFDNFRKRVRREEGEQRLHGVQEALRALLPAWDNLERALAHPAAGAEDLRRGIELTQRQWGEALRKLGVEPVAAVGQPFDPHLHQAIEIVDTTEAPDHVVLAELQRGYRWQGHLLRPAMVRVARNPASAPAAPEEPLDA
ncbi:MAG: nucleotide exchange factor GrpE [Terriglobales bacterium]